MTTDIYKASMVQNDGEQLVADDVNDAQRFLSARLQDQILESLVGSVGLSSTDMSLNGQRGANAPTHLAYTLHGGSAYLRQGSANNKLQLAPGVLLQKTANSDGSGPTLLAYSFAGTEEVAIANGDPTNPRVDIVQMKLELIEADPENRVYAQPSVKADLDLSTLTTHWNTKVRAKNSGKGGDAISISSVKRTSGTGVTYSENGNAILVEYQDGVSTVADGENAIIANSTLIEIESTGTGTNVLHDPADSFGYTHLSGGADEVLVTESLNKQQQVQCTLSVKQGTPAASPIYPDPDAGFVCVAGIVVGATYAAAVGFIFGEDTAGTAAVVHDQRMPINVQAYRCATATAHNYSNWTILDGSGNANAGGAGANDLFLPCPRAGIGRVVGIDLWTFGGTAFTPTIGVERQYPGAADVPLALNGLGSIMNSAPGTFTSIPYYTFEASHAPAAGPTVQASATNKIGPPVWADGSRCARPRSAAVTAGLRYGAGVYAHNAPAGFAFADIVFNIAQGL